MASLGFLVHVHCFLSLFSLVFPDVTLPTLPTVLYLSRYSQVEFVLTRRWKMIVLTVYLPTAMLQLVGYTTLFVNVALMDVSSFECVKIHVKLSIAPFFMWFHGFKMFTRLCASISMCMRLHVPRFAWPSA